MIEPSPISIVITTHHRPALLMQAISAINSQSVLPREVVVVDDGFTLQATEIDDILKLSPLVRVHPVDHGGLSRARNIGADDTTGRFILFVDDDDELTPIAIEELTRLGNVSPDAIALVGACQPFSSSGGRAYRAHFPNPATVRDDLWRRNQLSVGAVAVDRNTLRSVGGWDTDAPSAEDYLLWLKLSWCGAFAVSDRIVLRYRQHDGSMSMKGVQYFDLPEFKQAFRRNLPSLIRSRREDMVLTAIVRAQGTEALWYLRRLILEGRFRDAIHLMPRFMRGTRIALQSPRRFLALCTAVYRTTIGSAATSVRRAVQRARLRPP